MEHSYWIVDGFEADGGGTHWKAVSLTGCSNVALRDFLLHDFTGSNIVSLYKAEKVAILGGNAARLKLRGTPHAERMSTARAASVIRTGRRTSLSVVIARGDRHDGRIAGKMATVTQR